MVFRFGHPLFADRREAGRQLAARVGHLRDEHPIVLALPRGGVVVGFEIAKALGAPLDVIVARKLGAPDDPELAIGAVVDGDRPETVLNRDVMAAFGVTEEYLRRETENELAEIARRERVYRGSRPPTPVADKTVILVDDGIATGASIEAAIRGLRRRPLRRLVLAVPVAPASTLEALKAEVDDLICLHAPQVFGAVGAYYTDFRQTTDGEVIRLLEAAQACAAPAGTRAEASALTRSAG